jgi:eukaryotic-like serine/threonine-protein kinase
VFKFITGKPLWVNILAAIVILLLLLLLFLGSLQLITSHGKELKIPTVVGLSVSEARKTLAAQGFEVQIQDSIYSDTVPPLQVIRQVPEADNLVKVNRTVYLTINRSVAPIVDMPNLVGMTIRNANMILKQYDLKLEDTIFKPDFAKNSVLDQLFNGESIKPGTKIQQGSSITLVLGNGIGILEFSVPDLFGLTYRQAKIVLDSSRLILGAAVPNDDVRDTANAFVYRQNPERYDENRKLNPIRQGQTVDLWLTSIKPQRKTDSTSSQTP